MDVTQRSSGSMQVRRILLRYGLVAVLMIGMFSYSAWVQRSALNHGMNVQHQSSAAEKPPDTSVDPRPLALQLIRTWIPLGVVVIGLGAYELMRLLRNR